MRRTITLVSLSAAALIVVGCGKSDDAPVRPAATIPAPSATTLAPPTIARPAPTSTSTSVPPVAAEGNEDFIAKADAVCTDEREAKAQIPAPSTSEEVIPYLKRIVPIVKATMQRLVDLGDPPADAATWNEALVIEKKVLGRIETMLATPTYSGDDIAGDPDIKDWQAKAGAAFAKLGLKVCGK